MDLSQEARPTNSRNRSSNRRATAGALTSVVYSPGLGRHLGMGYLRTQFVKPDTTVTAVSEGGGTASGRVTRAPEVPEEALSTAAVLAMMGGGDEEEEE